MLFRVAATAALAAFSFLGSVQAKNSLLGKLKDLSPGARDVLKGFIPAAPRFMVYSDTWAPSLPPIANLQGYTVFAICFWRTTGASDMALGWQGLTDTERNSYLDQYNGAGISIIVSAFGDTQQPTTRQTDALTVADNLASWVLQYGVQGIDVDYEDLAAFNSGSAEQWLISLTEELRKRLPLGEYILTHAPVAPWFAPNLWHGGGYLHVDQTVGDMIDWYNVQFYNQGASEFTTCWGLLHQSSTQWPESALFQIIDNGVDNTKLVIGKPASATGAINGYMDANDLNSCVQQARAAGWYGGITGWMYPAASSAWINIVRSNTF